ncbi:MAG: alkaline phosphatase family protein [Clostridiales bacterium]|nr:alkaline phosphatase family protein [Clostridiales bacterium]
MQYPDYDHCLVNLTNSILKHFGAETKHAPLSDVDDILEKGFQNVVLMIFDGMGVSSLEHHLPADSFLRLHYKQAISSVFPPTTAAALTSIESGLTPAEHGWLGWSLYFKEVDKIVELFPNTVKDSGGVQATEYHVAGKYLPVQNIDVDINRAGIGNMVVISPYDGFRVTKLNDLFATVQRHCGKTGRKLIYAYWGQPDKCMHETGCESEQTRDEIRNINKGVQALCESLRDTLVIVTADHGHIDISYRFVSDYPNVMNALLRPPSIESRAAAFYVKEEHKAAFPHEFEKAFGDDFLLFSKEDVIEKGLFGNGTQHPRFAESIGDFLAVAVSDIAIAYNKQCKQFASTHAGLTRQEMDVPLIIIET